MKVKQTNETPDRAATVQAPHLEPHYGIWARIRWALCSVAGRFRRPPTRRDFAELNGEYAELFERYRALQLVLQVVNLERDQLSPELGAVVAIYGGPDAIRAFEQEEARGHAFTPRPPSPDGHVWCSVCALAEDVHEAAATGAVTQ